MRGTTAIATAALAAGLLSVPIESARARADAVAKSPATYEVIVAEKVMMPMRDGVRLAADLYLPARNGVGAEGRFPAVLRKWVYGRGGEQEGQYFASRGYVFVAAQCRGASDSEGILYPYRMDHVDGYDVVEWIAAQPWSNGKVGTYGVSHAGRTQVATAIERPPHLTAQFIAETTETYYEGNAYGGGAWMADHNLEHALGRLRVVKDSKRPEVVKRAEDATKNYAQWIAVPASRQLDLLFGDVPEVYEFFRDWVNHPEYDEYWKTRGHNVKERYSEYKDVPIYFLGGWYDHLQKGFLKMYAGISAVTRSPKKLIIGPWIHGLGRRTEATSNGEVSFGPEAAVANLAIAERFFAQTLKGIDTGILNEPPVRIFVMGTGNGKRTPDGKLLHGGRWRDEPEWPLARAKPTRFYLHAGGGLSATPPSASAPSGYRFDPDNPVPTIHTRQGGGWDQRCHKEYVHCRGSELPLSSRPDVLAFRTAPLEQDVEVTGPLSVTLFAASDALDTDFTAKLVDEYPATSDDPAGFSLILVDWILRARYRDSPSEPKLLTPNRLEKLVIELPPTSNVFKKGHRIRLDISSSNFPKFDVNPNTGERIHFHSHTRVAHNKIYHDPQHSSFVELPVVPSTTVSPMPR
jgi:putative CocE/NonD family hydrolase